MKQPSNEKFKTMIGGQALIEGILMRGPDKDAVVCRQNGELVTEVSPRKLPPEKSPKRWPLIRGVVNFFDSQAVGIKALMRSADLSPEETEEEPSGWKRSWETKNSRNSCWAAPWCWGRDCRFCCFSCCP